MKRITLYKGSNESLCCLTLNEVIMRWTTWFFLGFVGIGRWDRYEYATAHKCDYCICFVKADEHVYLVWLNF